MTILVSLLLLFFCLVSLLRKNNNNHGHPKDDNLGILSEGKEGFARSMLSKGY